MGYSTNSRPNTPSNPTTARMVSMMVQERRLFLIDTPKYSLYSQNPASFTCDSTIDPAPILRASRFGFVLEEAKKGKIKPAVVMPETVDDPVTILRTAAIHQAIIRGFMAKPCVSSCNASPTCISCNISLNAPAPPKVNISGETSLMDSTSHPLISGQVIPRLIPRKYTETKTEISSATMGSPSKSKSGK